MPEIGERGACKECRHANLTTGDFQGGMVACPWLGGMRGASVCDITYADTGKFVFESYNKEEKNCTWGSAGGPFRALPKGYENKQVVPYEEGEGNGKG